MRKICTFLLSLVVISIQWGCRTNGKEVEFDNTSTADFVGQRERIEELFQESSLLNILIRRLGECYPLSIGVMNGLETRWIQIAKPERDINKLVGQIIVAGGVNYQYINGYYFLFPLEQPFYEILTQLNITEHIPKRYSNIRVTASFGAGLELFNVFNSLNFVYKCNIVGDNTIAELPVGEVVIHNLPLTYALELILKSARIDPKNIRFCTGEDFIFIYTTKNEHYEDLKNCKGFSMEEYGGDAIANKRVTVSLPEIIDGSKTTMLPYYEGAESLEKVASSLANQLGLIIEVEPNVEDVPINPCYLNNLPLKTVLDLIKYQWLDRGYRYKIEGDKIVFYYELK